jgi:Tudor domain
MDLEEQLVKTLDISSADIPSDDLSPQCSNGKNSDMEAADVAALECLDFNDIIARSTVVGDLPPDGSYVMACKYLTCQSPEYIYCRPLPYETKYQEMMSYMNRVYSSSAFDPVTPRHSTFDFGSRCAAFVDGNWIRVMVLECKDYPCFMAVDLDNGQLHKLSVSEFFPLVPPFDSLPKMAIRCAIAGLPNKSKKKRNMVPRIRSALLNVEEVYICCPERPKAILPIFDANILFSEDNSLINLNTRLHSDVA